MGWECEAGAGPKARYVERYPASPAQTIECIRDQQGRNCLPVPGTVLTFSPILQYVERKYCDCQIFGVEFVSILSIRI